jgi:hypothetical protein
MLKPKLSDLPPPPPPTEEQSAIYSAVRDSDANLMLNALAGTGKSHTLAEAQFRTKAKPILYLVFNRKNADEAAEKMLSTTVCRTINGMGHRIWGATGRSLGKPDARKPGNILREYINGLGKSAKGERDACWASYDQIVSGVNLAKALGYVPEGAVGDKAGLISQSRFHSFLDERPDDLVSNLIDHVLRRSIVLAFKGDIDYNDQVYMPALWGGVFPKFPLVMVDEYQDLSPVNHALLKRLVSGRLIGVGDPWQNIYGFRGASAGGMAEAVNAYRMDSYTLSTSFRCPSAIVEHVHWHVPEFRASRSGGSVHVLESLDASLIRDDATIICRNNAPLLAMAFRLLAAGHSVSVAGTDIGPRVVAVMRKLGPESLSRGQLLSAIDNWLADKLANESKSAPDLAECMKVFAKQSSDLGGAISFAEHLFKQDGSIRLLTGHKSKGLEFDDVYHLDPFLCRETEQDKNLRYVISTRSADRLAEIDSAAIKW